MNIMMLINGVAFLVLSIMWIKQNVWVAVGLYLIAVAHIIYFIGGSNNGDQD